MNYLILFILGAVIGSFLNVVGIRWNSSLDLSGRSFCPTCRKKLSWWELVPILSFILLRGRCSGCQTKISWQYPVIEALTGLVLLSIYNLQVTIHKEVNTLFVVNSLLLFVIFCIYIVIVIYDLRHKIIPDELVYTTIGLGIFYALFNIHTYQLIDFLAGPVIFLFFFALWFFSKGRAMGFGDAKIGLSLGILLGGANGFSAVILAFWIGAVVTLSYMFWTWLKGLVSGSNPLLMSSKKLTMKSEIPFAPFLILGTWVSIVFNLNLLHVAQL